MDNPNAHGIGQFGVKLYRYKGLVKRNWWILALTASIGLAYQGWSVFSKPVEFESNAKLTIRESTINQDDKQNAFQPENFIGTNLATMKSEEVVSQVQNRMALEAPQFVGERAELSSSVLPRSYIFTVTARGRNPEMLPKFVDFAREEFINLRTNRRGQSYDDATKALSNQITAMQADLKKAVETRDRFVKENNMSFWSDQAKQATEYLSSMMTEQANLRTQLQRIQSLTAEQLLFLPNSGSSAGGKGAGNASAGGDSSLGQDLYSIYVQRTQDLVQLQSRIKERSTVWKPKHPKMRQLLEQETELKDALKSILDQHTKNVTQQKQSMEVALQVLQKNIAEQNAKLADASAKDSEFNTLKAEVERREKEVEAMRANLQALTPGIAKNDIFVKLGPATPAMEVPKEIPKHLLIGLIGGLVLGGAILMFRDRADDRLSSSSEMMERFNEPILGQIPDVMASRDSSGLPLLQPDDERYSFAEAFRSLRSSLIFMPNQQQLQTLLVTSAIPNEGKSTITANLGITMAAAGANIILVDADLRRGDLASLFDADGRTGLSNVLRGEVTWRDAIQQTKYNGLTLLPRGPVTNQSSELLLLPSLETLLDDLKNEYDLVLFNTAPILATDDTSSLAPHFDGSLMTIRAQFTSARLTHNALNALYQRQVNVLGLILNCVDTQMPDYYYYQYPKYYAAQ